MSICTTHQVAAAWPPSIARERGLGSDKDRGRREPQETDVLDELTAMMQFVFDVEA